jgi:cytoskeletal protein RodZ
VDTEYHTTAAEPEVHSAGAILRRCREFNSISLEDAAEATKIGKNYLRALEEDRPQDLPSPAYLKGFLKTYATYLGLQADDLHQLVTRQDGVLASGPAPETPPVSRPAGFNWQRLFLPAVLLAALIVSAIILSPPSPERSRQLVQESSQSVQPIPPAATAVQTVHSSPSAVAAEQPERPPDAAARSLPVDGFMVRMKVNQNSTLTVVIDDAASQGYVLTSGDLIEWKANRTIALDLSDAGSVAIELNGTPLKLEATPGKPRYLVLDANGIQ